jgi:tetratricopeptide (TPR) repeat protein
MCRERPLLGRGWGLFELFYPFYQSKYLFLDTYRSLRTHANNAHNEILEIASQAGLIGLGIFILLWVVFFSYIAKRVNHLPNETRTLVISSLAGIIGVLLDNLLNVSLHFVVPAFFFWLCVGACIRLTTPLQNKTSVQINNMYKISLLVVGVLLLLYIAILNIRFFIGEIHYFSGFKYSKMNKLDLAEVELNRARNFHLHEVNNNYELGNTYARKGKLREAIFAYNEALKSNLGYDEIYFNMASVYSMLGESEESIANFRRALYINPLSQEAYLALGSLYLRNIEKYTDNGINLFNAFVKVYPQNKDAWNNLGYLYLRKNDKEKAIQCFKKALEIDPSFELARRNLLALNTAGIKDALLGQSENKRKLFSLLEKEIEKGDWQTALSTAKDIIAIDPLDLKARLYLGNIYFSLKKYSDAVEEYKKILSISPQNVPVMLNLGIAYYEMNDFYNAKNTFETVLKIDPKNEIAIQHLDRLKSIK